MARALRILERVGSKVLEVDFRRVIEEAVVGAGNGRRAVGASSSGAVVGVMNIQVGAVEEGSGGWGTVGVMGTAEVGGARGEVGTGMEAGESTRCTVVGAVAVVVLYMTVGVEERAEEENRQVVVVTVEGAVERGRDRPVEVVENGAEVVTVVEVENEVEEAANVAAEATVAEVSSEERVAAVEVTRLEEAEMVVEAMEVAVVEV